MAEVNSDLQPIIDSPSSGVGMEQPPSRRLRFSWRFVASNWFVALVLGAIAAVLNLYRIGAPSLWFDEALSVERASQPLSVLWRIVNASQPNMALYYFLLHYWLALTAKLGFFPTEAVVRFPSAVFAVGASILLFLLARRFLGLAGGVIAAALYICNDFQLVYAQETRSYSLQLLLIIAGWYALLTALTTEKRRRIWFACYICAMVLAVYAHYFSLLVLLAQGCALVALLFLPTPWQERVRHLFREWGISLFVITLLILPMLYASRVGAQTGWIPIPTPRDVIKLFEIFGDDNKAYLLVIVLLAVLGLLLTAVLSFEKSRLLLERSIGRFWQFSRDTIEYRMGFACVLLCWLWVPIAVSYLLTQKSIHLFLSRYLLVVVPAFCLLAALGFVAVPWRRLRLLLAPCLIIFSLLLVPHYYASAQVEEWNTSALWIEHHYQPGDGLVCYDNLKGCQVGLEYYFHAYPTSAHFDADSPGAFSYVQYDLLRPAYQPDVEQAVNIEAIQRFAAHHAHLFYIVARPPNAQAAARVAAVVSWLDGHYQRLDSIKTSTVTVYLYRT